MNVAWINLTEKHIGVVLRREKGKKIKLISQLLIFFF